MRAFRHHLAYEVQAVFRNPLSLFLAYLLPLAFFLLMGLLMTRLNPDFNTIMVPGMIVFGVMSSALLGLPGSLVAARTAGVYRTYQINGVPITSTLIIPIITTIFQAAVLAVVIVLAAPLLADVSLPSNWLGFIGAALAVVFALAGLGVLIGVAASSASATVLWGQLLYGPAMVIGGVMFPGELLPADLSRVALILPATHAMRALRAAGGMAGAAGGGQSVLVLLAGGALALLLAVRLFSWDPRQAERRHPAWLAVLAILPYAAAAVLLG